VAPEALDDIDGRVARAFAAFETREAEAAERPARMPAPAEPTAKETEVMLTLLDGRYRASAWHARGEHEEVVEGARATA
jgi:hypothetical protein